jgi:DNA helicase-2/ATP-dependent DNA helicase PcrA
MAELVTEKILEGLNPQQKRAVKHNRGPLLIVAGAGTGKTRVIVHRIAYLIATKRAKPEEIVALTFTDKAAAEMQERVDVLVPYGFANVWISTFHAFGDRIIREHALELGLSSDFQVMSQAEQAVFLREHLFELPLEYYRPLGNPTRYVSAMINLISRAKDEDVSPQEYLAYVKKLKSRAAKHPGDEALRELSTQQEEIAGTYEKYQQLLAREGKVDFGDQVKLALKLLREHPLVLKRYQEKLRFILVDEFQDTNYAQFQLLQLLAAGHDNITVVGDDDQSIYKFRGAAISNILSFMDIYPKAKQMVLTKNYRSHQAILDTSRRLILFNNPERLEVKNAIDKRLKALKATGKPPKHLHFDTLTSQSDWVAQTIAQKKEAGEYSYSDFAILVRANADADAFLRSLNMQGIPSRFSGSRGLYSREEIRFLTAFLRSLANFDDSVSLYHLASSPEVYGVSMADLTRCMNLARRRRVSLHDLFLHLEKYPELAELSDEGRATIGILMNDLDKYLKMARDHPSGVVLYHFLTDKRYLHRLTHQETLAAEGKIKNIARFFEMVKGFAHLAVEDRVPQFVEHLDLLLEAGDDPATAEADLDVDAVNILTVHKAKGLEFPVVFMVSLVQDKFPPRGRSEPIELPDELIKETIPGGDVHLQEERRLFYVGMTRAQKELYLTSAMDFGGVRSRKVSQFVLEAMDKPRADQQYLKTSPEEAIRQSASPGEEIAAAPGTIPDQEVINLSHYQVDDYLTCPLRYKYVHILRVPLLPHHSIVYGQALHQAVQAYFQRKINGRTMTLKELLEIFQRAWVSEGFLSREHEEQRLEAGREALRSFYQNQEKSGVVPSAVEEEFSFLQGKNRVRGRWDRVDAREGGVTIVDFKSSQVRNQKAADRRVKDNLQLAIYALAYQQTKGVPPRSVELHFLESGLVGSTPVTEKMLQKTTEKIEQAAQGIRARDYTPKPSWMACKYCAYAEICPSTARG